jgi:hypothetical protein
MKRDGLEHKIERDLARKARLLRKKVSFRMALTTAMHSIAEGMGDPENGAAGK